ncbi:MAG: EAL domain-containing protein [Sulfurisoma sp.]|nr:EAL domain-containing protein [Sulfurisoma sp.]
MNKTPEQLRADAEARLTVHPDTPAPARPTKDLLHELQVHQIELEMQNETLRQTQTELEESRDHYLDLYEFAPLGYLTLSREAVIVAINLTGAALLGEDRGKLLNRHFANFVTVAERDNLRQHLRHAVRQSEQWVFELRMQRADGAPFHARLNCLLIDAGAAPSLRIALNDITAFKAAEEELRIAAIAFESQEGMMVTDARGVILRVNRAFTQLTGYSAEEAIGRTPALLRSGRQAPEFYARMWQNLKDIGYWQGEMWNRRRNGKIYAEWLTISAVTAADGAPTHYVGTFSEITKNKEAEAEIHRLAYYDPLTQLPNRRLFHDRLTQALAGSGRSGHYGALLFLDLDNFKNLNDTRGHEAGDHLLVETARRIQANVREGDTVARLGGDEFVVMLEDLSEEIQEAAHQTGLVGEKIRESLDLPYDLDEHAYHCSTSLGVTLFHGHDESAETLLKHADMAMYKAKGAGRNTLRFFDPAMQTALDERGTMESELRLALSQGQLELYYQPQIDGGRRVTGAEALIRWRHPERGLVSPTDFIPLAEETGLILPIGRWVLQTACARIKAWSAIPAAAELRLAVNVSARQFRQPDFVDEVRQVLAMTGANPARLKIELTESMVVDNVGDTFEKMHALKALGVGFSLDDFGTGHSSLSYLTRLPLDQLKIDRSFVLNLPDSPGDAIVAQTIISMARSLGLQVIAEGVETEAQREFLDRHQCHAYQGFLFSRPLPLPAFEEFLRSDGMCPVVMAP